MTLDAPQSARADDETHMVRQSISAVRNGNHHAFGILVQIYQRRLFGLSLMVMKIPDEAEEITQDAFVRAFSNLDKYDAEKPFYPWLATIAVRLAQSRLSKKARDQARDTAYLQEQNITSPDSYDLLKGLIANESNREVWEKVLSLPEGQRTAVFLHYRNELKISEVSAAMGVTDGTVKTLLFRARKALRKQLETAKSNPENHSREGQNDL